MNTGIAHVLPQSTGLPVVPFIVTITVPEMSKTAVVIPLQTRRKSHNLNQCESGGFTMYRQMTDEFKQISCTILY